MENLKAVSALFCVSGDFLSAAPYGSGHINDTYVVAMNQAGATVRYIFQRLNTAIFREPVALMHNIRRVTEHQRLAQAAAGGGDASRRALTLVPARDGGVFARDADGGFWRVYWFIEKARTYDVLESPRQAFEAARAFARFQRQLADLPGARLHDTIPDFHHTPRRFAAFRQALDADACNRAATARAEIEYAMAQESRVDLLLRLHGEGRIPERITHNDTKINNVMLDDATGEGLCVIDLDTVMPGLALYDFGDMVRTSTSPAAEDERDLSKVCMQLEMFERLVRGYLSEMRPILTPAEIDHLGAAAYLITFEIGVRFLADYLVGDTYFKTHRDGHNLDRCRTQFELARDIDAKAADIEKIVARCG